MRKHRLQLKSKLIHSKEWKTAVNNAKILCDVAYIQHLQEGQVLNS